MSGGGSADAGQPSVLAVSDQVARLLHRLVHRYVTVANPEAEGIRAAPDAVRTSKEYVDQLFMYLMRVLGSRMTPARSDDEYGLAEYAAKLIARRHDADAALAFRSQFRQLGTKTLLANRAAVLQLLLSVSAQQQQKSDYAFSHFPIADVTASGASKDNNSSSSGVGRGVGASADHATMLHQRLPVLPSDARAPAAPVTSFLSPSTAAALVQEQSGVQEGSARPLAGRNTAPWQGSAAEHQLLRDVTFAVQGVEGRFIKNAGANNSLMLISDLAVSVATRNYINQLCGLGMLFRRVLAFLRAKESLKQLGLVEQAMCAAVRTQVTEYYRAVAVIAGQVDSNDATSASAPGLTLRRLLPWSLEQRHRMQILLMLIDAAQGAHGGQLAGVLAQYHQHGDPFAASIVHNVMQRVSAPIFDTIRTWISEGRLVDPYEEFFVAETSGVSEDKLWSLRFTLRDSMLPGFLSVDTARLILLIGKTIFLLQRLAGRSPGEKVSTADWLLRLSKLPLPGLDWDTHADVLRATLDDMRRRCSKRLMAALTDGYKLRQHLAALKRYLLLGQGDFVDQLMDAVGAELYKPASTLYRHNLIGVMESAIRTSNAQYDDPDVLARLDVRLLEPTPGASGWDVFSLDYRCDAPLNCIITADVLATYLRVFNFLWRLKRVEYSLSAIWRRQVTSARQLIDMSPDLTSHTHRCHVLRHDLLHFIQQLSYYLMFEVLETSWRTLQQDLQEDSIDLDALLAAHQRYLDRILQKSLLQYPDVLDVLADVFDLIIQFRNSQEVLYTAALEAHARATQLALSADTVAGIDSAAKRFQSLQQRFRELVSEHRITGLRMLYINR